MPPPQYETRTPEQHFEELVSQLNIPHQLAQAIREQESGRLPRFQNASGGVLTSDKNARGWFQVLPETAAAYGLDANDPFQNIEAGLRNIKEALDKNGNDPDLAARYYHGGSDRRQWGPLTEEYGQAVGRRMRALLAADGGQATPASAPARRTMRTGAVPTAEELRQQTQPPESGPPAPPWYAPDQLLGTAEDLGLGVLKGAGQTASNLGRGVHAIPGVSAAIDALYGEPGLSARAFGAADDVLRPTNTTQQVGKFGEQIGEAFVAGGPITRTAATVTQAVAPRLAPLIGETAARLLPRAAVEATGAAALAKTQGQDPTTAAGIAAAIPAAGAVLRLPFSSALPPVLQRAVDFGRAHGIPIDLATATANQWVRRVQTATENTPLGAPIRAAVERLRGNRMTALGDEIAGQIHPTSTSPVQAGHAVGGALDSRVAALKATARTAYQEAERIHGLPQHTRMVPTGQVDPATGQPIMEQMQLPIALSSIRQTLRPVLNALLRQPVAQQEASPALAALQRLFRGGPFRSLMDLEADLGAIKQLADASGGLRDKSQGLAAKGVQALQDAIDTAAAQADPNLLQQLQRGRRTTAIMHVVDDLRTKFMGTAKERRIRGAEPMRGYNQALQPDDVNIEYLTRIARQVGQPQMRRLGRGFVQDLLETATAEGGYKHAAAVANQWERLGPQTKALLYDPKHIEALDNFFRLGRRLAEHPNPSGTAVTGIAAGMVPWAIAHPETGVPSLIGSGIAAGLMNTAAGVQLLTKGLTIPGGTPAAAAWLQQIENYRKTHAEGAPDPRRVASEVTLTISNKDKRATPPPAPPR